MPLFAKLARRPLGVAALAVVAVTLAPLAATPATAAPSTYADAVLADGATHLWRLDDSVAGTSVDSAGGDDLVVDGSATRGAAGPMLTQTRPATSFSGAGTVPATTTRLVTGPQAFSVEAWFRTTSTTGGKIVGFGSSRTGSSQQYDRHLFLTSAGTVTFGVFPAGYRNLTSAQAYNNGQWHHVVGSMSGSGMELFVDGRRVGHDTSTAGAEQFSGYWRVGGDNLSDWPGRPGSSSLAGSLADVAVYSAPLSLDQVQSHYRASGRTTPAATVATDAYGSAVVADRPSFYWRLDETSGTGARDEISGDPRSGSYTSAVVLGEAGAPAYPAGRSVRLPGTAAASVNSTVQVGNPTVYSLETWFRTTTTRGGRLIGFGSSRTGTSASRDRHVYMLDTGQLRYGIFSGQIRNIDSPKSYNDGAWHHVVATQGPGGQRLYVDGEQVATGSAVTPQNYTGYWRLGTDTVWAGATTSNFAGSLDEAAVYPTVLGAQTVAAHHRLGASPNVPPTAAFTSTVSDLTATFDASGSTDPDGAVASYAWDFGDGTSGTGVRPAHAYSAAGTYTVALTVRDDEGGTGLVTATVVVAANAAPAAAFTAECTDLDCSFDAGASTDPDGELTAYRWDLGDGAAGTGRTATHRFPAAGDYDVTLTVTDEDGATDRTTQTVTVAARNDPPTAVVSAECADLLCTVDGTASTDPDGRIVDYAWDFGDGTSGEAPRGAHRYAAAGTYTATLTVTDDRGATGSASVVVTAIAPNRPPTAVVETDCTYLACSFDAARSRDPDGSVTAYAWDFGDGATSSQVAPQHTFAEGGTYQVELTVTDDDGATGTVTEEVTAVDPILARDAFGRAVGNGLGTADRGGAWSFSGLGAAASVVDGSARVQVARGSAAVGQLGRVSNLNTELNQVVWLEGAPTGTGVFVGGSVRVTPLGAYRTRVRIASSGGVTVQLVRAVGVIDTLIGSPATVTGLDYTAGTRLRIRSQAIGASPTTVRAKVWVDGTPEPAAWTVSTTDSLIGYQQPGAVGLWAYATGTASTTFVRFDDVVASIADPL